jgi:hypothetical protein
MGHAIIELKKLMNDNFYYIYMKGVNNAHTLLSIILTSGGKRVVFIVPFHILML